MSLNCLLAHMCDGRMNKFSRNLWYALLLGGGLSPLFAQGAVTLQPDYAGVTVPNNIAPLNFNVCNAPEGATVQLKSGEVEATFPCEVRIAPAFWRRLLAAADLSA